VNPLQEPPMSACRENEILIIGKILRPSATGEHHAHGQILVDNDHRVRLKIESVGVCLATQ
jgi:hypothetical protein